MNWLTGALLVLSLFAWCSAFPKDDFLSYGTPAGDAVMEGQLTPSVPLKSPFYVYGTPYTSARVTRDGTIFLLNEQETSPSATLSAFRTKPAPSNNRGNVFYRMIADTPTVVQELQLLLNKMDSSLFGGPITPTWAFVATWSDMTHPSSHDQGYLNTFQAVLIGGAEWRDCFAVYMYNRTDWPTVEDRGTSLAGIDAGDMNPEHKYILPGSQVGDVVSVVNTTNVRLPGMWAFKIGQDHKSLISEADEFYLAFPPTLTNRLVKLYALITTNEEEQVPFVVQAPGVNNFQHDGVVQKGEHVKVAFPQSAIVERNDNHKGILIKATNGKKVSVIGVVEESTHVARFPVLHQRNSSSQFIYYAANQDDYNSNAWSFIVIVATGDDTTVTVRAAVPLLVGRRRLSTGREMPVDLRKQDTILISSPRTLTGTRITSSGNPIVVFSGHSCTQIPVLYQSCDTIMEQIPSTYDWGKEFIASPLKNRKYSLLQIIAAVTPTYVAINCMLEDGSMLNSRNLSVGERTQGTHGIHHNQTCSIVASNPIMLIEYGVSRQVDTTGPMIGGPAMILVPSVMQYSQHATMVVQHSSYAHFVNLVIPEVYFQPEKIKMNMTHTLEDFNPDVVVYCKNCSTKYYVCQVTLPVGEYSIMHSSKEARFSAISYGHYSSSSYGCLAGMTSSGVYIENKRVKAMLNNSYEAECINTTSQEMFWRRPNGSVVSVNSYLKVNNSRDIFMCEVPFMGSEPAYVYKETVAFSQDGDSSDTDQPEPDCSKSCAFTARVLPNETVVEVGGDVTFHCIFPDEMGMFVTWQGPNLHNQGSKSLFLKNVNISSSGNYTCSVENDAEEVVTASTHLTVQRHLPVIRGHGYRFNMSLNGTKSARVFFNLSVDVEHGSIEWSRYNGKIPPRAVMKQDGSLMIMDAQLEDAGRYTCTAKNRSGEVTSEVFEVILEVQPPTMVMDPVNQTILVNSTLLLSCYAVGYGTIAYQWEERHRGVLEETGSHLVIEDIEGHSAGEYTCLASNEGGITESQSAFVGVLKPGTNDVIVEQEMAAFVGPYELVASEGDNASFFCYGAYGSGGYSYLWFNNQNELVGNKTSLDIPFLTSNMTGVYTCLALDDTGQEANGTIHLTVLNTTLEIIKHPCNVDISITDRSRTVTFQCTVNRIDARYQWEMENQTITNRALGVNSSLLVIPNLAVSDAGRYRCTVSDGTRNISSSFAQLTISVEPPVLKYPPSDVTTAPEGNVTLACHAHGYGPLTYTWEKKGIGVIQTSNSPLFDVVNATAVLAGLYRCSVINLYGEKVVSLYFRLIVRYAQIVEYKNCNSGDKGTEVVLIQDLKSPSFLNHQNLLLDGPVFSTSRKLSKTLQMVQKAMVYVCHEQQNNFVLSFGVAISSKWVLTTAECEDGRCGKLHILPTQNLDIKTSIEHVCRRDSLHERGVVKVQPRNVHTSPNGTSLVLLQMERRSLLRNFIPKDTFLARKALMKIKSGYTVEILGTSFDNNKIGQPARYKYKIRSELLPDSAAPSLRSRDECSGQLPSTCSWIPGSPIIYAPPQTSQFAVIGITVPREECEEGGAFESHLSLQPDLEWIETIVEY